MNGLMAAIAVTLTTVAAPPKNSDWKTDYALALKSARASQRPLLVVLEKPDDPRQSLEEQTPPSDEPWTKLDDEYELCRVDVTTNVGKQVADAFGATQFPYTAVTDKQVKVIVHRKAGRQPIRALAQSLAARIPGSRLRQAATWSQNCFT